MPTRELTPVWLRVRTTIAVVALAVAVALGYGFGRLGWGILASQVGFVSQPARMNPAVVLRSE